MDRRFCISPVVLCGNAMLAMDDLIPWRIGIPVFQIDEALAIVNNGSEDPKDWMCLIATYQYSGDAEKAYEWFLKALPKFSDEAGLYFWGGDVCKSLKRYEEAFQYWRKSLELDGEMHDARYSMGFCYEELGEYDKAYEVWLGIARDLEKDGCEIEKQFPLELAEKCKAILANHNSVNSNSRSKLRG